MTTWMSRQPRLYRFLERQYADAFFETGALRLSSFHQFARHTDEQRLDGDEGTATIVHRNADGVGNSVMARIKAGEKSYVLCASLVPSRELMKKFGADSAIIIIDPRGFADAVAAQILNFRSGTDGPCSYQADRYIEGDLGPGVPPKDVHELIKWLGPLVGLHPLFLKHSDYMHQNEWRMLWDVEGEVKPHLDLVVPEARKFCRRWELGSGLVAFGDEKPSNIEPKYQLRWTQDP